ncbi:FtsX-like permease family protein [Leifsonia sp. NPDC056665]|uniref:FtsX-like permease family protein n=1 Tax=Leifsonia sp. NPDC056665 TaxID=3345901 RepID=UPI0036BDB084
MTARARTSRLSDAGLALRALRAFRGGLLLLALVTVVAATALAAWPRVSSELLTSELQHELTQAGAGGRDVTTAIRSGTFNAGPALDSTAVWRDLPGIADRVRQGMKAPLRAVVGPGDSAQRSYDLPIAPPAGAASNSRFAVGVEAYRGLRDQAKLVSGAWPSAIPAPVVPGSTVEVVLTPEAAKLLGWTVGASRAIATELTLKLSGLVEPRDASSDFWNLDAVRARGHFLDAGDAGKQFGAVVWVDADSWPRVLPAIPDTVASLWFPVAPGGLRVEDLPAVRGALGSFLALPPVARVGDAQVPLTFATSLPTPLDAFQSRAQPANTLFAILAAGPLVVALTVLALGARLVVSRRREALALMAARGASPWRLRGSLALDGALASVPAAAVGLGIAFAATPDAAPVLLPVLLALLCALAPPLALVLAAGSLVPRPVAPPARWAWVAEVIVLGLAALSVVLLARRGLSSPGAGLEVDPLAALTPVLVALAACVVVLRVTAVPLAWLTGALRRGRGAVAFLGAAGSLGAAGRRGRSHVLWPVFALIAGASIALFSVSVLATARDGLDQGARARVGADLSLTAAAGLSTDQLAEVKRLPGVAATATVDWAGGVAITAAGSGEVVSAYLVDPRQLEAVQRDLPASARLSTLLTGGLPGRTGAVLGGWDSRIPVTSALIIGQGSNVHLAVTELDFAPGVYVRDTRWAIIDRTTLPHSSEVSGTPQTVLVALAPGADAAAVHAALARIGGKGALVGDAVAERAALHASPLVAGTEAVALLSIALTALLCIAALLLTLVMNTAARVRLVATLRTVGFSARQTAGVLAWELGPVLVVGLIAGTVVGLLLPGVVLGPLDLRGFTGSPVQPAIVRDPWLSAAALAGFTAVAALATLVALAGARRSSPSAVLRAAGDHPTTGGQ